MTHDPYYVTPRKPLTAKQKLKMFVEHGGICCLCGTKIDGVKQSWDEHVDPLWRDGTNDMQNRRPAHVDCARKKTAAEAQERAKGQRIAERHFGAKERKSRPMPGTKASGLRKRMNGTVERRS
jgi:5-methylcytosine-specific restriction enzyme A